MRNSFFFLILVAFASGCAYQIQPVPYGIDEMPPSDRRVVNEVLNSLPICQQWSWTNDSLGRSYTVKAVDEYQSDINTHCKIFSVSTTYPINSRYRDHKRVIERACKSSYNSNWVYGETDQFFGFKWGGDLRLFTKNTVDEYCATKNTRNTRYR